MQTAGLALISAIALQLTSDSGAAPPVGRFVFDTIHDTEAKTPVENLLAMFEAAREHGRYPMDAA
jgi:hypothetical protein